MDVGPADVIEFKYFASDSGIWEGNGVVLLTDEDYIYVQTISWHKYNHKFHKIDQPNELLQFPVDHRGKRYLEIKIIDD